ncbi:MAG TPA: hypothetical protein VMM35_07275 [Longimicrobiales bacterium]|nr:hypothetical protein [Longimicrobiales bacterium]
MRSTLPYAMALLLAAGACSPAEVVVTVEIEVPTPDGGMQQIALSDVEVQLLPFDRDAVFDSLTQAFPEPEPEVPEELIEAREEVQAAQAEWDASQRRWGLIRDTLQTLLSEMEQYNRGEAQYLLLYREFQDFEGELTGAEQEMDSDFARFDSLQRGTIRASDSIRILQDNWADEAFAGVVEIYRAKQLASGLPASVDTTNASGVARENFRVPPGQYWVYARYPMTYTELYWNVPVTVERGDPVQVTLTRANAEERIRL